MIRQIQTFMILGVAIVATPNSLMATDITKRVSLGNGGVQGNAFSEGNAVSADGRFVAFTSGASNLVPNDTNGVDDVFVRDRQTGKTERVSLGKGGVEADYFCHSATISANGRFVAFLSAATNLLPGNETGEQQFYVYDRQTGQIWRASVGPGGVAGNGTTQGTHISGSGRFLGFTSFADNLVAERHATTPQTSSFTICGRPKPHASVSRVPEVRSAIWARRASSACRRTRALFQLILTAREMVPGASDDGIVQGYIHDRKTGKNERVTVGPGGVQPNWFFNIVTGMSVDGRFVGILSGATNLIPGGTNGQIHVFIRDRVTGKNQLASVSSDGAQGNDFSSGGELSANGRYVAFGSSSTNLVANDTNGQDDIFVHDRKTGKTRRVSAGQDGVEGNGRSNFRGPDGERAYGGVQFGTGNLVPGDSNDMPDVFINRY